MPVVVITGAGHGIGEAIAGRFSEEPNTRLALLARTRSRLEEVADACRKKGADARVYVCDVTDDTAVAETASLVESDLGVPDVLVNNAGRFLPGNFFELSPDEFRHQIEINLTSAFLVTRAFLDAMTARGSGDIFFMASVASVKGYPRSTAYCAAKHGLLGLARALREETRENGIRVMSVIAGATRTASWAGSDEPEDRFMPADDIARCVLNAHKLTGRSVTEEILLRPQLGDL